MNKNWIPLGTFIKREFNGDIDAFFKANRKVCGNVKSIKNYIAAGFHYIVDGSIVKYQCPAKLRTEPEAVATVATALLERQNLRGENIMKAVRLEASGAAYHGVQDTVYTLSDSSKIYYSPSQHLFYILKSTGRNVEPGYNKNGVL